MDVTSRRGVGTTFLIRIPLTLAIMPALIVTVRWRAVRHPAGEPARGGPRPPGPPDSFDRDVRRRPYVPLARTVPSLGRVGSGAGRPRQPCDDALSDGDPIDIVALQAGERQFGLVVSGVLDTEEIVVKALGRLFSQLTTFAGATIMGDGQVALILDVAGLAQRAGVLPATPSTSDQVGSPAPETSEDETTTQKLLVMGVGSGRRMALPIELVHRIEGFSPEVVERSGNLELVQYRDEIVPSARVSPASSAWTRPATDEVMPVVLAKVDEQTIGLVVDEIVDIVEEAGLDRGLRGRDRAWSARPESPVATPPSSTWTNWRSGCTTCRWK